MNLMLETNKVYTFAIQKKIMKAIKVGDEVTIKDKVYKLVWKGSNLTQLERERAKYSGQEVKFSNPKGLGFWYMFIRK